MVFNNPNKLDAGLPLETVVFTSSTSAAVCSSRSSNCSCALWLASSLASNSAEKWGGHRLEFCNQNGKTLFSCSPSFAFCRTFAMASVSSSLLFNSWLIVSVLFSLWSNSVMGSKGDGGSAKEKVRPIKASWVLLAHQCLFSRALPLCLQ